MPRKPIPEETQRNVLLRSRRRCCLCFWLHGKDEVQKGQIAHLDGNNENASEDNLVFLCFDHHDEYDGTPRLAKGLRPGEVKHWRNELYKEMLYRFKSIKTRTCELALLGFKSQGPEDEFSGRFQVKNTGDVEIRRIVVAIRLPDGIAGEIPPRRDHTDGPFGIPLGSSVPSAFELMWGASESREDLFEPNGRVCIQQMPGVMSVLMPGHSFKFDALLFRLSVTKPADSVELEYRIDAEEMTTVSGKVNATVPSNTDGFLLSHSDE